MKHVSKPVKVTLQRIAECGRIRRCFPANGLAGKAFKMDGIVRIGEYLKPYRWRIATSIVLACIVSVLWSLNLSITFPIVKFLFKGETVQTWVDSDIASLDEEIADYERRQQILAENDYSERARLQRKLNSASQTLAWKQWMKTTLLPWVPDSNFKLILSILIFVVGATAVKGVAVYFQDIIAGSVVASVANDVRKDTFANIMKLDYQTISSVGSAQLASRLTNDVTEFSLGLRVICLQLIREPLKAGCCILAALIFNWRLTCISMIVLPLIGFLFYRSGRLLRSAAKNAMETMGGIYNSIVESLGAARLIIAFDGQNRQLDQLETANSRFYDNSMKLLKISSLVRPTTELLGVVAFTLVLLPGAYLVLNQTDNIFGIKMASAPLEVEELATLYVLLAGILDPVRKLSGIFPQIKRSFAAGDRIFVIMNREASIVDPETPVKITHSNSIEFENLSVRYGMHIDEFAQDSARVISDLSLKVNFGETVAIVGGNGSGKSTLVRLLPRLLDPETGGVKIDGVDIRQMPLADLRRQIGYVDQDTVLFNDTILNNIRYGSPDATKEQVEAVLKKVHAWDLIESMPDGLETRLGEGGRSLSGGQKQRLALARGIIRDPKILILDEATSAIDTESEVLIYKALQELRKTRTILLITHVLNESFIQTVDRVVVMKQGELIAAGTHSTLSESCHDYRVLLAERSSEETRRAA